jgi:ferrous iron transport protein B
MKWFKKSCCKVRENQNSSKNLTIGLVGNPNCGKTTVFNALTGSHQSVGNWPGVTVERKSGFFTEKNQTIEVIDLPGAYSLTVVSEASSIDERIACEYILNRNVDVIVNILDASNLERHLYLTLQLIEMRVPMILAVNMMDIAKQRNIHISLETLEKELGCPVIALEANKNKGIDELKQMIAEEINGRASVSPALFNVKNTLGEKGSVVVNAALSDLTEKTQSDFLALRLLEDDVFARQQVSADILSDVVVWQKRICDEAGDDADILLADARYRFIQTLVSQCVTKKISNTPTLTSRIDNIVLNRVLGIPIFLGVMYLMFFFAINIGGAFQDFFDISSDTVFVGGLDYLLTQWHVPTWLTALIANGVGKGINTTITFIPVIGAMFLFLAFLEDSGYMARAAFVVDRFMRMLGLPGKSFVPMVVGFGCNVPGVMAARTLENKRDRILTVMMSPFMSCGARLAIYAVFTAAFFPVGGQNIIFALYLIGIVMAMLTGFLLRKTILKGDPAPLVMELPPYHVPNIKTLGLHAWQRLKGFVVRAGKLIVPICILIGALNALNLDGTINGGEGDSHSLLSTLGQWLTPIFSPMGIHQDNWPATVGLVTGVLAKEVVVGTLNTLYSQLGHFTGLQADVYSFWGGLHDALVSIPANIAQLGQSLSNPVLAKAPVHSLSQSVYGLMYQRFDGQIGAIAYLLFVLLYFPCVSTTAAMLREVSRIWTVFSVLWTTGVAYCVAVTFYQAATFARHPLSSFIWIAVIASVMTFAVMGMRAYAARGEKTGGKYEFA